MNKEILEAQLNRFEKDKLEIQQGISQMENQIGILQNQIVEINKQIERNRGALSYAHILSEETKAKLAAIVAI